MPADRSTADLLRQRLRSPLRWLCAVMGGLMALGIAGLFQSPPLMLLAPVVTGLFLLSPPIGIYKHDEAPVLMTRVRLESQSVDGAVNAAEVFRLSVVNDGDVAAENFRIRLLLPVSLVPAESATRALGTLHLGALGTHWFTETTYTATAFTFRAGKPGEPHAVACPPRGRCDLIDLHLPAQRAPYDVQLDYQINGGTVTAALAKVCLRSS